MQIFILSKSVIFEEGIKYILNKIDTIKKIEKVDNINSIDDIKENDIVIIDVNTIKINEIKEILDNKKVLAIDSRNNKEKFYELMKQNIDGYVVSKNDYEPIIFAIQSISKGNKYYDGNMISELSKHKQDNIENKKVNTLKKLTKRENEIILELSKGKSNKEIGLELDISENTVKKHLKNIFEKLNIQDRTQAVLYLINLENTN